MSHPRHPRPAILLLALLGVCAPAGAVITRLYPLADVTADADTIVAAKVRSVDTKRGVVTVIRVANLKGNAKWPHMWIHVPGADDATQVPVLTRRLTPGRSVIWFSKGGIFVLGYVDGTWFRLAPPKDSAKQPWQFVHLELYLRRTFRGSSAEMRKTVVGVVSGNLKAPEPDPNAKPGYGD